MLNVKQKAGCDNCTKASQKWALAPPSTTLHKQLHQCHTECHTPMLVQNRLWQLGQHSHPGKKHSHLRQKLEIHFKGNYFPGPFLAGTHLSVWSLSPLPLETSPQRLTINGPDRGDEMIQKLYKSITVVSTFNMKLWNIYPTTAEHQQLVFWIILHFSSL